MSKNKPTIVVTPETYEKVSALTKANKVATEIVEAFEDLLDSKGILIPCDDEDEEAERRSTGDPFTTREEMKVLRDGDVFYVNGLKHTAKGDSHRSGDSSYEGFVVYDENDVGWFEEDFSIADVTKLYGMEYYGLQEVVKGILLGRYHNTHRAKLHFTEANPPAGNEALQCDIFVETCMTESELKGVATAISNIVYHANMGEPLSEFCIPDNWEKIGWKDKIRMVAEHMSELIGAGFCVEIKDSVNAVCINEKIY